MHYQLFTVHALVADRVVLAGAPSPLRSAAAQRLKAAATLLACLDTPAP